MTNPTNKNHLEEVLKVVDDKALDGILHEIQSSHLRSISRRGAAHLDAGVHFCPICRESYKKSVQIYYTKKLELEKLRARKGELASFVGSRNEYDTQLYVEKRIAEIDDQIAELEKSNE